MYSANKLLALLSGLFLFTACKNNMTEKTLWVNSAKVDCVGVGPMQCYQIKESEEDPWTFFYQQIDGFDFQPGYIYRLKVQVESLDIEETLADKSNLEYTLVEVLSKEVDPVSALNDLWKLTELNGSEIDATAQTGELPNMELNTRNETVLGFDGCNNYRGKIEKVTDKELVFGPMLSTRKLCPDMTLPNQLGPTLSTVSTYKKDGLELQLFDATGSLVCRFKKID